jgi:hypothetical protein
VGNRYKAAFLIPASAKKTLEDAGWLFETEARLRPEILDRLKQVFSLEEKETYSGIVVYVGDGIKISVIHDDADLIEHIAVQLLTRTTADLSKAFHEGAFDDIEIFVP